MIEQPESRQKGTKQLENKQLEIGSGDVTELELMALWLALDLDRSGFLDAQDFGAFMKKGRK